MLGVTENCQCPANVDYVCGSDGKTYSNGCRATCAGVTEYTAGRCADAGGTLSGGSSSGGSVSSSAKPAGGIPAWAWGALAAGVAVFLVMRKR